MKVQVPDNYSLPQEIIFIAEALKETDSTAYLVGGILRDSILKITNPDIDIAVVGDAKKVGNSIATIMDGKCFELDSLRGIYRVISSNPRNKTQIDIATIQDGIHHDVSKRDFTINSLALDLNLVNFAESVPQFSISELINDHRGIEDLKNSCLRMTNKEVFQEDPLRKLFPVHQKSPQEKGVELLATFRGPPFP